MRSSVLLTALLLLACNDKPAGSAAPAAPAATAATTTAAATATAATTAAATTAAAATSGASASSGPSAASDSATSASSSTASPAGSAGPAAKTYDCGKKGQKLCPLQGWMKGVMTRAVADANADKLAAALTTVAGKAPAGMGEWPGIAAAGAAKAKAGDIDGAKESCKKCHSLYQKRYKETMRDAPW